MKNFLISCLVIAIAIAIGCSATRKSGKAVNLEPERITILPLPVNLPMIDTPIRRPLSDKEIREYLNSSYRMNFDQLLSPEFRKLNELIKSQAEALKSGNGNNQQLLKLLVNTRERAIKHNDSLDKMLAAERDGRKRTEEVYIGELRKQVRLNNMQIKNLNDIANMLLAAGATMIVCILGLAVAIYWLWKKVHKLGRTLHHA